MSCNGYVYVYKLFFIIFKIILLYVLILKVAFMPEVNCKFVTLISTSLNSDNCFYFFNYINAIIYTIYSLEDKCFDCKQSLYI